MSVDLWVSSKNRRFRAVERTCEVCGTVFLGLVANVKRGKALTCSVRCRCLKAGRTSSRSERARANHYKRHGLTVGGRYVQAANRATSAVTNAVRKGKLVRPETCSRCGQTTKVDAHHADYSKPLDVEWLCRRCHIRHHYALEAAGIRPEGIA